MKSGDCGSSPSERTDEPTLNVLTTAPTQPPSELEPTESKHQLRGLPLKVVIFSLCSAQFIAALDITIVATALPTIASRLHTTTSQYTWIGSSYNLASTASTPIWAKLSDITGRKPMLLSANAVFMAGSLVAGFSMSPTQLIAGRSIQGLGGGGIMIMIPIVIADLFPLRERAKYYGLSSIVWAVSSASGPVLGGVFTQTVGWRWCFFINLPFEAISFILLWFILRIKTPRIGAIEALRSFDWIGSLLIVAGTVCFLCGLEGGSSTLHGWKSPYTLCLIIAGVLTLISFVVWENKFALSPVVSMKVFIGMVNIAALTSASFHAFGFISYDYFLPLYYQVVLGTAPILSGVYLFVLVIPLSFLSALTGVYIKRTGNYHYPAWLGSVIMLLGTGLFINFDSNFVLWKIIVYPMIAGIGAGPLFLSPMLALQDHLQAENIATGISAFTFLRSIATSVSIVIGGVVLQKGLGGIVLTQSTQDDRSENNAEQTSKYTHALHMMWIFYTAVCGITVCSSLMITKKRLKQPESESASSSENEEAIMTTIVEEAPHLKSVEKP